MTSTPHTGTHVDAVKEAAAALDRGGLAILRTETVYGVFARGDNPEAIDRIRALPRLEAAGPWGLLAWHAGAAAAVLDALDRAGVEPSPTYRRVINRAWPGPVTLRLRTPRAADIAAAGGLHPGVANDADRLSVRVPDDTWAQMTLQRVGGPVVASSAEALDLSPPARPGQCPPAVDGVDFIHDAGATRLARHSTVVDLADDGSWTVASEGALTGDQVRDRLATVVLFVCTGNTCRSPMAEAIARGILESRGRGQHAIVLSAGVSAVDGATATPEAVRAVEAVGGDLTTHRSQPLTDRLVERADAVFAMTESHLETARSLTPPAQQHKLVRLDADADTPDPIGGPQKLYDQLARRLSDVIRRRLEELDL
ncbi:MAG: Sua5/YciO/YrdC/YwlC family protein [Planctomycetota bacterium]